MVGTETHQISNLSDTPDEFEVPLSQEELLILCIDTSASMRGNGSSGEPKSKEVYEHLVSAEDGLFQRLGRSSNRQGYHVAAVFFDDGVRETPTSKLVNADDITIEVPPENLFHRYGPKTAIGTALGTASNVASKWLGDKERLDRIAYILLLSDGGETATSDPVAEAQRIKNSAKHIDRLNRDTIMIATVGYGAGADENLLKAVASEDYNNPGQKLFFTASSGSELRSVLLASIGYRG